jgi:hypothetical protein
VACHPGASSRNKCRLIFNRGRIDTGRLSCATCLVGTPVTGSLTNHKLAISITVSQRTSNCQAYRRTERVLRMMVTFCCSHTLVEGKATEAADISKDVIGRFVPSSSSGPPFRDRTHGSRDHAGNVALAGISPSPEGSASNSARACCCSVHRVYVDFEAKESSHAMVHRLAACCPYNINYPIVIRQGDRCCFCNGISSVSCFAAAKPSVQLIG